jgi:hypothetical protein
MKICAKAVKNQKYQIFGKPLLKLLSRTVYYKVALNFCLTPLYFWNLECSDEKLSVKVAIVFLSSKQND